MRRGTIANIAARCAAWGLFLMVAALSVTAQELSADDPSVFIGFSLRELVEILGPPERVYAVRGTETWQDDVVFAYRDREFYFYRDRIWQIGLRNAFGVSAGEKRDVIPLIMGDDTVAAADHSLVLLRGRAWPLSVRFNIDGRGLIASIFIYRSDF
jgi:hypothetical protein